MKQIKIQESIEKTVTNGLGYEPRTSYLEEFHPTYSDPSVPESVIKNTVEGLKTHLGELDLKINPDDESLRDLVGQYKRYIAITIQPRKKISSSFGAVWGSGGFPLNQGFSNSPYGGF